jgi:hypothetical protein
MPDADNDLEGAADECSVESPHSSLWLEISSPVARRVVEAVMIAMPEEAHSIPPATTINCPEHQLQLHMRLRQSGLAQRIAAGPDTLPSIYDYSPRWQHGLAGPDRPRTPEQLAVHVMHHLEWYLEPPRPVSIGI